MKGFLFATLAMFTVSGAQAATDACTNLHTATQNLVDALAPGDAKVWDTLLDPAVTQTDENGTRSDKPGIISSIKPLPKGVSGNIHVTDWICRVSGDTAVVAYVDDEHEKYHGHELHALYRATDTWHKTPSGWRMIASQLIALQRDPPAVRLPIKLLQEYVGRYAISSDDVLNITLHDRQLMARSTGQKHVQPIMAELPDVLFTPGQPRVRKIVQRDATGRVIAIISRREGRDVVMQRLR